MYYNLINSMSRGGVSLDVNVQAFITANGITDTTYINALNTCVLGLKSDGLYSGIQCWHIYYGNAFQSKFNFKNPVDTNAGFRLTFFGTGTINNNGFLGNGTNAYAETYFIPSSVQNVNSNGFTAIIGTNNATISSDTIDMGALTGGTQASFLTLKNPLYPNQGVLKLNRTNRFFSCTDAKGIWSASRNSGRTKLAKNGTVIVDQTADGTLASTSFSDLCLNISGGYGHSTQRMQQRMMHIGFSDAEIALLNARLDTFENALGRKTW